MSNEPTRARVIFMVRVPLDRTAAFLEGYEKIRYSVAEGVPGHLLDQVCRSDDDPEQWLITSEWETLAAFQAWESSPDHRDLVRPLAQCITERRSLRFLIHKETRRRTPATSPT